MRGSQIVSVSIWGGGGASVYMGGRGARVGGGVPEA